MQRWEASTTTPNWCEFKKAMLSKFQPTFALNVVEVMLGLKQEGMVREFRRSFEALFGHLKIQDPELILGMFSNGLRKEIGAEVRPQSPKDLVEMMDAALLADEKLNMTFHKSGGFRNWKEEPGSKQINFCQWGSNKNCGKTREHK